MQFSSILLLIPLLIFPLLAQTNEGGAVFGDAAKARRAGELKTAVELFRQIALNPDSPLNDYAQFEIAETYYSTGEYSSAAPEYQKVIADYENTLLAPRALLQLGKAYLNLKKYASAEAAFRSLLTDYAEEDAAAEARYLTAKSLESQKKWKAAYLAYEETDLYHPLSYFGKKSRLAIRALKKTHKKKLPRFKASAEALLNQGMAYFNQDDFEMAANIFNRLAREFPRSKHVGEAWLMLGRAEMQTNKFPSAISDLERASRFEGRAHYYLGLAHGRRGHYDRAIAALNTVIANAPSSPLAQEAAYWIAYYQEVSGDYNRALQSYYAIIKNHPYSKTVSAAVWRLGRIYYWNGDFKNAAVYFHSAQLYPPGENTARCYFFEAKALERLGDRPAALAVYKKLAERFDHAYYSYRAQEKLELYGVPFSPKAPFTLMDFGEALDAIEGSSKDKLSAIMEIWEQTNPAALESGASSEAQDHLAKYKELMNLGLTDYAAEEARFLVDITSDDEKESAQAKLAEMLINSGEYRMPIRYADRKVKSAVISGKAAAVPKKIWQIAYPRGYWKQIAVQSKKFGIDPYLALAVIREESRFNPRATSRSSARGLMQIMPRTGRGIAKDLKLLRYRTSKLYTPAVNINMGTYYLAHLVKNFSNNLYLALAGYNGGPNRIKKYVKSWYNGELKQVDIDEFVESIPSLETRLYVQKVMESYFEYKRLYDRKRG